MGLLLRAPVIVLAITQTVRATLPDGGFNCALMLTREFSLDGLALVEMLRSSLM